MSKHAYLIMAHDNFEQLSMLLKVLDDFRNDIFVHIDRKASFTDHSVLHGSVKKSKLVILKETISVHWGGYSQIACEFQLMKAAVACGDYSYIHLLSGRDFPLWNQDQIHAFFDKHNGKEFIEVCNVDMRRFAFRYKYYYPFLENLKKSKKKSRKAIIACCAILQKLCFVDRTKNIQPGVIFKKGANWFSITGDFAKFVLEKEDWVKKIFFNGFCCDEIFLQTLLYSSGFKNRLYYDKEGITNNLRYTDWKRGNPYTFRLEDYQKIKESNMLFVRKVDRLIDCELVEALFQDILVADMCAE